MVNTKIKLIMTAVFLMVLSVLLLNRTACADYYYLSAGTTGGDEDGSSLANAWKTISAITGVSSGDTIYCAGTLHEQFTVADSVSYVVIADSTCTIDGDNTRQYGFYGNNKSGVIIDGFTIKKFAKTVSSYGVYITGGTNNTVKNCDISEVYYTTNPTPGSATWEQQRGYGIYAAKSDSVIISGNTVRDVGGTAIMVTTSGGVDLTYAEINNNEITNFNVGIRLALGDDTANINNGKIYNNYIHDFNNYYYCTAWHRDGIHIFARSGVTTVEVGDIEIYNNYFVDTVNPSAGGTAWIYIEYNCPNYKIHHNVFDTYLGAYLLRIKGVATTGSTGGHEIYNNTFSSAIGAIHLQYVLDNKIKNNIINLEAPAKMTIIAYGTEAATNLDVTNNLLYGSGDIAFINATYYTAAELAAANINTDGVYTDPVFVGGTGSTAFQLQVDSPAIDAGMDLGFTADAIGDTIPQGVAPEIGAFEFNTTPTPPSGLTQTVNLPRHSVFTFVDNASDEDGFQVMINGVVTDSLAANTETFSIDNQTPGATYNVQIRAYKGDYLSGATVVNFTAPRYRLGRVR